MVLEVAEAATQKQKQKKTVSQVRPQWESIYSEMRMLFYHISSQLCKTKPGRSSYYPNTSYELLAEHGVFLIQSAAPRGREVPGLTIACYQVETIKEGSSPPLCKLFPSSPY